MKPRVFSLILLTLCVLLFGAHGIAQDTGTHVGIGVSIDPPRLFMASGSSIYSNVLTPVNIYVPITGPHFRVEPDLGFYSSTYQSSLSGSTSEDDGSIFHVGAGAFYLITTDSPARIYIGPRIGLNFVSTKSSSSSQGGTYSTETSETDFTVGLCVGGEYMLSSQFSVGGEAQLNYISFGQPDVTNTPPPPTTVTSADITRHLVSTNVLFFFRWFF